MRRVGVKSFATKPLGKAVLIAVAILTLLGSFIYLGELVAIAAILIFGLALPIYFGWKRPRTLALAGLVILLIAAPLASVGEATILRTPGPDISSASQLPYGKGGSVLQGAHVTPYTGPQGGLYTFTVVANPAYVPPNDTHLLYLVLFVSTCPGATGSSDPTCPSGYPFYSQNHTFASNVTIAQTVTFNQSLPGANIWWWQMGATVRNVSGALVWIFLQGQSGFSGQQGPVSGNFLSTVGIVIPTVFLAMFFYPGIVFFFALLVYMYFKARERRRKAQVQASTASEPPTSPEDSTSTKLGSSPTKVEERTCLNCGAVVYPSEKTCWKCGASLTETAPDANAPLPSNR